MAETSYSQLARLKKSETGKTPNSTHLPNRREPRSGRPHRGENGQPERSLVARCLLRHRPQTNELAGNALTP